MYFRKRCRMFVQRFPTTFLHLHLVLTLSHAKNVLHSLVFITASGKGLTWLAVSQNKQCTAEYVAERDAVHRAFDHCGPQ